MSQLVAYGLLPATTRLDSTKGSRRAGAQSTHYGWFRLVTFATAIALTLSLPITAAFILLT